MKPRILLVNPPTYDFSAYDFWLRPYGMLRAAGFLRNAAQFGLFDYLDRHYFPDSAANCDAWGRGPFNSVKINKPSVLSDIPRHYRRFGLPREQFHSFLHDQQPFDFALVQTVMTYWYPGVREVIEDLRKLSPQTKIALGGVYATLCANHAATLGADLVVHGTNLDPLWRWLGLEPDRDALPLWNLYRRCPVGVLKLANGCPFRCTYCSVPQVDPLFTAHPLERSLAELDWLTRLGARHIAFYDDALLYRVDKLLMPFLEAVRDRGSQLYFHTPNALNARFITPTVAEAMVAAGFRSFFLGFESSAYDWQHRTGGKVYAQEFAEAVENLRRAGAGRNSITAYLIIAHPETGGQALEESMHFAHEQGVRIMLSEFSPIPGTPDGEQCRSWVDLDEPLNHNKTAFAWRLLGKETDRLKELCRSLNQQLGCDAVSA